MSIEGTFA